MFIAEHGKVLENRQDPQHDIFQKKLAGLYSQAFPGEEAEVLDIEVTA